jgi:hypothetical protein
MAKSKLLSAIENTAYTENGAITNASTGNAVLDLFSKQGAMRNASDTDIIELVEKALQEDFELTLKSIFYNRDAREGYGERRFFRVVLKYLADTYPKQVYHLVQYIPEFGRWDDVLELFDTKLEPVALDLIYRGLRECNALCAKWMPRQGKIARKIQEYLEIELPGNYRRMLVGLTEVVESKMCTNKWDEINYSQVPSRAMHIYKKAFSKHDCERFGNFLTKVEKGEAKINSSVLYPHEIVSKFLNNYYIKGDEARTLEAQWKALPNWLADNDKIILPICDVSGSMEGTPLEVSVGLGIYIAERNKGMFQNYFMTFSTNPKLQLLKGNTLQEKVSNLNNAEWNMNTNLQAAFDTILTAGIRNKVDESEMPKVILIISDMEFDIATPSDTNYEAIEKKYNASGYELPKIVFWNVNARTKNNSPVVKNTARTSLISGFSASILKPLLSGNGVMYNTPYQDMLDILSKDRYNNIRLVTENQ